MWLPQDEVFWYLNRASIQPCRENITADVAIIGGGMAGLSAAQAFVDRGKKVVLLEQYYCGAGASGKSSGFVTPNAELSLTDFAQRYTLDVAHAIWKLFNSGVEDIRKNILENNLNCDYVPQNTLVAANNPKSLNELAVEYTLLKKLGYTTELYTSDTIKNFIGSDQYYGGVGYYDSFGINAYQYCQEMKKILSSKKVEVFEETPVTRIDGNILTTPHAQITAKYIIACGDRFLPNLNLLTQEVYHAQTFLMVSQILTHEQIRIIFPDQNLMVWDTDLIYTYYRMTGDNRLLLGGGSLLTTYSKYAIHDSNFMRKKLTHYFKKKFPQLDIQFEHMWPGLIGLSKDIVPLAGPDKDKKNLYYISACAGLPIATALGRYSVEHLLDGRTDLDIVFNPYRSFAINGVMQTILGIKLSFALSNMISKISA